MPYLGDAADAPVVAGVRGGLDYLLQAWGAFLRQESTWINPSGYRDVYPDYGSNAVALLWNFWMDARGAGASDQASLGRDLLTRLAPLHAAMVAALSPGAVSFLDTMLQEAQAWAPEVVAPSAGVAPAVLAPPPAPVIESSLLVAPPPPEIAPDVAPARPPTPPPAPVIESSLLVAPPPPEFAPVASLPPTSPVPSPSEDPEVRSDDDLEATSDEDPEAASDEDLEAASDEDPEAASDEDPEAASDEDLEAASDEDPEPASDEDPLATPWFNR